LPWRIYVDKSLSIKYHKQPSSNAYKKGIQKLLAQLSEKGLSVEAYSFGSKLDTLINILDLKLDANSTNFGLIADHINKDYKNSLNELDLNLDLRIRVGENLPWYAAILGGLPAVAGSAVINKVFEEDINDLSNYQYEILGTISQPELRRIK